jgi:uncharacterized membrane protein
MFGPQNGMIIERGGDHGGPSGLAWTIFALLLVLLLIALVSLVLDFYYRSNKPSGTLAVLDARSARGEITRDAYLQARTDLGGKAPAESEATTEVTPPARRKQAPPATADG